MMYGYGFGGWWMMLMPLLWIGLIAVVVWVAVRLVRPDTAPRPRPDTPTPMEILDTRYARGEIDDAGYVTARARLSGQPD